MGRWFCILYLREWHWTHLCEFVEYGVVPLKTQFPKSSLICAIERHLNPTAKPLTGRKNADGP